MSNLLSRAITPITDLKTRSREIVKRLQETGKPVVITQRGRAAAIMESVETYEKREDYYEAIEGLLQGLRQAEKGDLHDHKEALKILESFK